MNTPEPKNWISLGLLLGGHSERPTLPPAPGPEPQKPLAPADRATDEYKLMRDAGYQPTEPYPGKPGLPWPCICTHCRKPRRPKLRDVENGQRCKHNGLGGTSKPG
ncbi:hypothetical protein [Streptomyces luteireticuli]|uniref:hypothetical protein n=1 Tax=Streptomyces luteireticuli TaxID=173858 RepID=UPI0035580063